MTDLISRSEIFDLVRNADNLDEALEAIDNAPAVTPQVYINVTGGVADVICADHVVGVTVLDYDITDNEDDEYCLDEAGDQVWIYGESAKVDPERCQQIVNYPTVAEARDENGYTNTPDDGHRHVFSAEDGLPDTGTDAITLICIKCGVLTAEDPE